MGGVGGHGVEHATLHEHRHGARMNGKRGLASVRLTGQRAARREQC